MKRLVAAFFMVLVVAAVAQQPTPVSKAEAVKPAPAQATSPRPQVRVSPIFNLSAAQLTQLLRNRATRVETDLQGTSDLCYTMHSFVFQRHNGGDAVRQVNESTCTPASRFRTKSAVATVKKKK